MFAQQDNAPPGIPASAIVTAEAKDSQPPSVIHQPDLIALEANGPIPIKSWVPFEGANSKLDLLILIDDGLGRSFGTEMNELRSFIQAQPETTSISIGYMQNGTVRYTARSTSDHAQAAKSLRLPLSDPGISGSPYFSLSDAIKHWPEGSARGEVLMITDGIDRYGLGTGLDDPYLNASIHDAQRKGIVVFSIYTREAGHLDHSFWRGTWGQNFLSQVADETGGESYWIGPGNPVTFQPFLDDLTNRLAHQYRLTILAAAQNKSELVPIKLHTNIPNTDLAYPDRIWVAAGM